MRAVHVGPDRRDEWNALIASEPRFSLHQSWEWGDFKETLGWEPHRIAIEDEGKLVAGALLLLKRIPAAAVGYVGRGPLGNWDSEGASPVLLEELERTARDARAVFLRLEPGRPWSPDPIPSLVRHGFRPTAGTIQPEVTLVLNLGPSLENILKGFRGKTRQYIHHAMESGITVRPGEASDLPAVRELFVATARRVGFPARLHNYYESEWRFLAPPGLMMTLLAFHRGRLIAARTMARFGRHAAEFHAGSVAPLSKLHPNHLLVWEAIRWAKGQGCETYDLWGVPDEVGRIPNEDFRDDGRTDGLWGVYRFKRGFSRDIVRHAGTYDLVLRPRLYALMAGGLRRAGMFERLRVTLDRFHGARRKGPDRP